MTRTLDHTTVIPQSTVITILHVCSAFILKNTFSVVRPCQWRSIRVYHSPIACERGIFGTASTYLSIRAISQSRHPGDNDGDKTIQPLPGQPPKSTFNMMIVLYSHHL